MGLDAVVFKNSKHFEGDPLFRFFTVDPITGEVCSTVRQYCDDEMGDRVACRVRIGNIWGVARLSHIAADCFENGGGAILVLLSEGIVPVASLDACEVELKAFAAARNDDRQVVAFCEDCQRLIAAARQEGNPIVIG